MTKHPHFSLAAFYRIIIAAMVICTLCRVTAVAKDDFPAGTYEVGNFTTSFAADGRFQVREKGELVVEGKYSVIGDQMILNDEDGRYACKESGAGKYRWKYDGKVLRFEKVEDECEGRVYVLSGQPLIRKGE